MSFSPCTELHRGHTDLTISWLFFLGTLWWIHCLASHPALPDHNAHPMASGPTMAVSVRKTGKLSECTAPPCAHPTSAEIPPLAESESQGWLQQLLCILIFHWNSEQAAIATLAPHLPPPGRAVAARNEEAGSEGQQQMDTQLRPVPWVPGMELCTQRETGEQEQQPFGAWNTDEVKFLTFIKCPASQPNPTHVGHLFTTLELLAAEFTNSPPSFHYTPGTPPWIGHPCTTVKLGRQASQLHATKGDA